MRIFLTLLAFVVVVTTAWAANSDAEAYAKRTIDQGFAILRDDSGGVTARRSRFHAFIIENVDANRSAMFALGQYRRNADPAALKAYAATFTDYAIEIYESRLENYKNATLSVTGSLENKAGDITVNTLGAAPNLHEPVRIAFRLLTANGSFRITDIQVEGIWLSIELRDEFASLLSGNGGDIAALTRTLAERTQNLRDGHAVS